jgi:hypothetical protein
VNIHAMHDAKQTRRPRLEAFHKNDHIELICRQMDVNRNILLDSGGAALVASPASLFIAILIDFHSTL